MPGVTDEKPPIKQSAPLELYQVGGTECSSSPPLSIPKSKPPVLFESCQKRPVIHACFSAAVREDNHPPKVVTEPAFCVSLKRHAKKLARMLETVEYRYMHCYADQ
jgi:hypothetical protein